MPLKLAGPGVPSMDIVRQNNPLKHRCTIRGEPCHLVARDAARLRPTTVIGSILNVGSG